MKNIKLKVLLVLIVILVGLFIVVCVATDMFKSPKVLFYQYLTEGNIKNITEKNYDDFLKDIQSKKGYEIMGNFKFDLSDEKNEFNLEKQLKLNMNYTFKSDGDKNSSLNIKEVGNLEKSKVIDIVKNDTKIGIKEKDVSDKYTIMDLSKAKETIENMKMDASNLNNASSMDKYLLAYISKEDRKTILDTYKNILFDQISNENYSVIKNSNIEVNGNKYKCKVYKLKLNEAEIKKIYINCLEELKRDELTINLFVEKYNMANVVSKDITKDELIKNIQKEIDKVNSLSYNDLEIAVYVSNFKTIRTEIIYGDAQYTIDITKNKEQLMIFAKVNMKEEKFEILFNRRRISENNYEYKIIYVKNEAVAKIQLSTNKKIAETTIAKLSDTNTNNIENVLEEKIEYKNNLILNVLMDTMQDSEMNKIIKMIINKNIEEKESEKEEEENIDINQQEKEEENQEEQGEQGQEEQIDEEIVKDTTNSDTSSDNQNLNNTEVTNPVQNSSQNKVNNEAIVENPVKR